MGYVQQIAGRHFCTEEHETHYNNRIREAVVKRLAESARRLRRAMRCPAIAAFLLPKNVVRVRIPAQLDVPPIDAHPLEIQVGPTPPVWKAPTVSARGLRKVSRYAYRIRERAPLPPAKLVAQAGEFPVSFRLPSERLLQPLQLRHGILIGKDLQIVGPRSVHSILVEALNAPPVPAIPRSRGWLSQGQFRNATKCTTISVAPVELPPPGLPVVAEAFNIGTTIPGFPANTAVKGLGGAARLRARIRPIVPEGLARDCEPDVFQAAPSISIQSARRLSLALTSVENFQSLNVAALYPDKVPSKLSADPFESTPLKPVPSIQPKASGLSSAEILSSGISVVSDAKRTQLPIVPMDSPDEWICIGTRTNACGIPEPMNAGLVTTLMVDAAGSSDPSPFAFPALYPEVNTSPGLPDAQLVPDTEAFEPPQSRALLPDAPAMAGGQSKPAQASLPPIDPEPTSIHVLPLTVRVAFYHPQGAGALLAEPDFATATADAKPIGLPSIPPEPAFLHVLPLPVRSLEASPAQGRAVRLPFRIQPLDRARTTRGFGDPLPATIDLRMPVLRTELPSIDTFRPVPPPPPRMWDRIPIRAKGLLMAAPLAMVLVTQAVTTPAANPTGAAGTGSILGRAFSSMRNSVVSRAAVDVADDFRFGTIDWIADDGPASGWKVADGALLPASLALYKPSVPLSDYRVEFAGQIRKKALGFAVRAANKENYYAVKIVATGAGPMPKVAVQRFPVIAGVRGEKIETTLHIPASADTVYHIAVDIQGDHASLSIQGQIVDTWTLSAHEKGGIGFFEDKGEIASIHGLRITHQTDTIGRLCAWVIR